MEKKNGSCINSAWGFSCHWLLFSFFPNERKNKMLLIKCLVCDSKYIHIYHSIWLSQKILWVHVNNKVAVAKAWRCWIHCPRQLVNHRWVGVPVKTSQLHNPMPSPPPLLLTSVCIPHCFSVEAITTAYILEHCSLPTKSYSSQGVWILPPVHKTNFYLTL